MIPFLTVLFSLVFMVGMVDLIVYKHQLKQEDRPIWVSLIVTYQTMLGSHPPVLQFEQSKLFMFLYIGMTIVLNIMTLNLLISIISTTYEKMNNPEMVRSINVKQKAEMLADVEMMMVRSRNKGEPKFMH